MIFLPAPTARITGVTARSEPDRAQGGFNQRLQELGAQALGLTTTVLRPLADPAASEQTFHEFVAGW